jgi:hypothetical protein
MQKSASEVTSRRIEEARRSVTGSSGSVALSTATPSIPVISIEFDTDFRKGTEHKRKHKSIIRKPRLAQELTNETTNENEYYLSYIIHIHVNLSNLECETNKQTN